MRSRNASGSCIRSPAAVVVANFRVEAPDGWEPTLNEEHDRHDWATIDDATALMYWLETQEAIDVLAVELSSRP